MHMTRRRSDSTRKRWMKAQSLRYRQFARGLALAFIIVAAPFGWPRSFAQVSPPPGASNPLAQVLFEVEDMRIRVENIQILSEYCKPPYKSETQSEINREWELFNTLLAEFGRVEQSFVAAGNIRTGTSFRASFPVINGVTAEAPTYWPMARAKLSEVQNLLTKKQQKLTDALERDCALQQARQQPVKGSQPPPDPLAGLTRPTPRDITFPQVPAYFCSELERRQWYFDNFESEWLEAAENVEDAAHYRAEVSKRGAEHFIKDGDKTQQKRLDAEERWADKNMAQHVRTRELSDSIRDIILHTPIIDCSLLTQTQRPVEKSCGPEGLTSSEREDFKAWLKREGIREEEATLWDYEDYLEWRAVAGGLRSPLWLSGVRTPVGPTGTTTDDPLSVPRRQILLDVPIIERSRLCNESLFDLVLKADPGTAGTPRVSPEPAKAEEKQPGILESLSPLIPSFGFGIGGGTDRERRHPANPCAGKK